MRRFFCALAVGCLLWTVVLANQVSYQGILTNSGGDSLLNGAFDFSFSIFPTATGGTARWTETHTNVDVQNGVYSVLLGETTPLPDSIGASNWLQISVEATVLLPRLPITADFRAIEARHAQNSDSVNHIGARSTPTANHLVPLGADGKFPESVLPFTLDSILAGQGLTGVPALNDRQGGNRLDERLTLNVGAGTGITVTADQVSATLGTSIATAEIEDNAVTTGKVQDNTLTAADISPDIVSSVDGVSNDGGNIDLIAGANITITPNDANNTITIAAAGGGGGYSAGRCISLVGNTIANTMTVQSGDECINVVFDSATCAYDIYNTMNIINGVCTRSVYDTASCTFRIDVDLACLDSLIQVQMDSIPSDSVFDSEVYAKSFVVTDDGTLESAKAHLTSDGYLIMHSDSFDMNIGPDGLTVTNLAGDQFEIGPRGWGMLRADGKSAGTDSDGEVFAPSFWVRDPATGDTLIHLASNGEIHVGDANHRILISPDHVSVFNEDTDSWTVLDKGGVVVSDSLELQGVSLDKDGIFIGDAVGANGHLLNVDGTCNVFQNGEIVSGLDSDGEMYAKSFYVPNPEGGEPLIHLTDDGQILINGQPIATEIGDHIEFEVGSNTSLMNADGVAVNNGTVSRSAITGAGVATSSDDNSSYMDMQFDGTWEAKQNGQVVSGLDTNGEVYAKSFYVRDSETGDTLLHITSNGQITDATGALLFDGTNIVRDGIHDVNIGSANGVSVTDGAVGAGINKDGLTVADFNAFNVFSVKTNGTWEATRDLVPIAALDSTGEIIAKSFEVRDSVTGITKAHLTNEGNLELPEGAQVLIGGVPIGGGGGVGDQIEFTDGDESTFINAGGVAIIDQSAGSTLIGGDGMSTYGPGGNGVSINANGTWSAGQNNVTVAGLQNNGEIHAKSFEVRDSAGGPILAHLQNSGGVGFLNMPSGVVASGSVFGATRVYSSVINGNTQTYSEQTPTFMRSQTTVSNSVTSGWRFGADGTMTHYFDPAGAPPPVLMHEVNSAGQCVHHGELWMGPPAQGNHFLGLGVTTGIGVSGNMTIYGKLNTVGPMDPIICEQFPVHPRATVEPGMVLVQDVDSDFLIPCHAAAQTGVIGVIPPKETVNENGNILLTILGFAAAPHPETGARLEMRVKADAKYGAIKRGDLLTTSATPGHAMLASDPKLGTIVGKALESLESGTGEIKVMVTLQ